MASFTKELTAILIILSGCSGMEGSLQKKLREQNIKKETIDRKSDEYRYQISIPCYRPREKYPWEVAYLRKYPKITKEFFRCKGSHSHPPHLESIGLPHAFDCGGFQKHSLPIRNHKEFIYPILIDLLNEIQEQTGCKVVITCGHRCPTHNSYADSSIYNRDSKHMIGAEVDFYVQGMEYQPEKIVNILMDYYKKMAVGNEAKEFVEFKRSELGNLNVSTPAWYNQEIFIKLYQKTEGRDFDNRHPYPYLSIQVRYDRETKEKVICDWKTAFHGYQRY